MNQKPDEFPDKWVRHTLSQLPDSPPPGSSFDSERLWGQLRPELEQAPTRRLAAWVWLVAAACLAGLTLGWFSLQSISESTVVTTPENRHKVDPPIANRHTTTSTSDLARSKPVAKERPDSGLLIRDHQTASPKVELDPPVIEPIETVAQTPEVTLVAEVPPVIESKTELRKPSVAVSARKQRFKVVHENELRAEEETRPKLYPTENFVRIGTGGRTESSSDGSRPALIFPLTHKPNQ